MQGDGPDGIAANWTQTGNAFRNQPTFGENVSLRRAKPAALAQLAALGGNYWNGPYPVNKRGDWWIGTAENRPHANAVWGRLAEGNGDQPQGTLTSKTVRLDKPFLSFQIAGRSSGNFALERLELLVKGPGAPNADYFTVAKTAISINREVMETVIWDLHDWVGKPIRLRLVDASPTGHLNVDCLQFTDTAPTPLLPPVWGLADTHAHPAAQKGFGGQLYWGETTGDVSTALRDCTPGHGLGGTGLDTVGDALLAGPGAVGILTAIVASGIAGPAYDARPLGDFARGTLNALNVPESQVNRLFSLPSVQPINAPLFQPLIDLMNAFPLINQRLIGQVALAAVGGGFGHKTYGVAPGGNTDNHQNDFDGWPRFDDKIHQHMPMQWVHRAYDGGLRLMVALAVNNELLANLRPKAGGAVADLDAVDAELADIKAVAGRPENASWMEIAYTPSEARRIINQNKLALVLGVEVDSFGEREPGGRIHEWGHESDLPVDTTGKAKLEKEIQRLQAMGVRHVFPIHLTNNAFGGCSIYEDVFNFNQRVLRNSFVEVDTQTQDYDGVQFRLFEKKMWSDAISLQPSISNILRRPDLNPLRLAGGLSVNLSDIYRDIVRVKPRYDAVTRGHNDSTNGHLNAMGLTAIGSELITRLMQHHMIIDVDHMSRRSTDATLALAKTFTHADGHQGYPVTSGHSSFRPVSLRRDETPEEAKWPHESDKSDDHVRQIIALGGMVSPIMTERDARQIGSHVVNDCAGSDKSWAQEYSYALSLTGGRNIGIGTDMAMLGGFGPRFGTHAAHARTKEEDTHTDKWRLMTRRDQIERQTHGVVYKTPLHDIRPFRWEDDRESLTDAPLFNHDERNAFLAVAAALDPEFHLDRDENKLRPVLNFGESVAEGLLATQSKWMINVVKGFRGIVENPLLGDAYRGPDVQRAALLAKQRIDTPSLRGMPFPSEMRDNDLFLTTFRWVTTAYRQYHEFISGGPDALTRCVAGPREFDFNFDGMAHYGMLPDFLQDLRNIGLTQEEMNPLFNSAEAYIQMWEKCEAGKKQNH